MNKQCRKTIIAGNWKMNKLASQVPAFGAELKAAVKPGERVEAVLCVPYPLLPAMVNTLGDGSMYVGAQDVSAHESGAYTGEVSASMLKDLNARYCIVGHSERRAYHRETDGLIHEKLLALLGSGIRPILCVGETLEQRDCGITLPFVGEQLRTALAELSEEQMSSVVIAYEPIWAIGTGRTASAAQAQEVCAHIRAVVAELYGKTIAQGVSILYGGSMNAGNAPELLAMPDIDGGLIGGASLKPGDFARIIEAAHE